MDKHLIYEVVGYTASLLVAISLMMSSILKLRVINLLGAAFFSLYGLVISAYPIAAVNLLIVGINLYYLYGMWMTKEYFKLLEVRADSAYLKYFLNFYGDEIRRFSPEFDFASTEHQLTLFILRDMVPAGLLIGEVQNRKSILVRLDFVIPQYRDFKVGAYLFVDHSDYFRGRGIQEILSAPGSREHAAYLRRMGFVPAAQEEASLYRLAL